MAEQEKLIQINALSKTFLTEKGETVPALSQFDLEVRRNDFISIVGPSGCGKSTLLRIIAGLETASSGETLYKGKQQNHPQREIGMVFQQYSLMPWLTVEENITLGLRFQQTPKNLQKETARRYLELIGMGKFSRAYPYELSGGMQQRVAIARALANDPEILLMDEPFGALDAHTRILMQRELLRIWEQNKKTVLFVTHSVDEAIYLSDKIVVMSARPGRIKAVLNIGLQRPRSRSDPEYGKLSDMILNMLEAEHDM